MQPPPRFGGELRRRRLTAGLSLGDLARLVHYSKAQLSKVERGLKQPSRSLVMLCDGALGADGALAALAPRREPAPPGTRPPEAEVLSRRQMMAAGAASVVGLGVDRLALADGSSLASVSRSLFDQYRRLGQSAPPSILLPALIAQTSTLCKMAARASARNRADLLILSSRYAEYVGWLAQENGDERSALRWTRRAVDLAAAGGDHGLSAYGLVREALITLYGQDAALTVALARRAQASSVPPRVLGLAAQREAQGHAIAGDHRSCMRSLDRAREHLPGSSHDGLPVLGTTNLADPASMITGWCLYDLGRPRQAAEILDEQLAAVPPEATRTHVRYGLRRALAYAAAGEVDHACTLVRPLLSSVVTVGSATVAADLGTLSRIFTRHRGNPLVRDLSPELSTVQQFIVT